MKTKYFEELKPKLIYVFRINDGAHRDCLKIGEATMDADPDEVDITAIAPGSKVLNKAARNRIDQYTATAGIAYELLYTEAACYRKGSRTIGFNDKDVHEVLKRSGIRRKEFRNIDKGGKEWFITDLETVKRAIAAVKEGRESLNPGEVTVGRSPIEFRPEQAEAIAKTVRLYKKAGAKTRRMLWNAKMRFGKTLSALQVAKEMQFARTLILTHRPVVDAGWFEDFDKIFYDSPGYAYGSKNHGSSFANLESRHKREGLKKLDDVAVKDFNELKGIIGQTKAIGNSGSIDVNTQGLTNEEYEEKEKLEKKKKRELTDEEKARLEELKKKKKVQQDAISILRGISIRMPLLIYGAKIDNEDEQLTIDNFTSLVDAQSWEEFMPRGVTKATFNKFKRYYDSDIFAAAGKRIRAMARAADRLTIEERIERITDIFSTFRNPDKETVLTPWRVVNMHLGDTLGGYTFFNDDFSETIAEPRYIDRGAVTADVFSSDSHLLEINSKSGLYPLYLAYNVYRTRLKDCTSSPSSLEAHLALWDAAVAENIFVICKTPMAKAITRRTLLGFRRGSVNMWAPEDLINKIKNQPELFIKKVHDLVGKDVKINAIVGNPPYQEMNGGGGSSAKPIYDKFVYMSSLVTPSYISMIMPSRWMTGGKGLDDFRAFMLANHHIRVLHDYLNASDCFSNVAIEGGICYFLINSFNEGKCQFFSHTSSGVSSVFRYLDDNDSDVVIRDAGALSILSKVIECTKFYFSDKVLARNPFSMSNYEPEISSIPVPNGLKIFGRFESGRDIRFLPANFIPSKGLDVLKTWKVFISKADGAAGQLGNPIPARIIGQGVVGDSRTICTETFLAIAPLNSEIEANNVIKYCRTKFFRFMVGIRKLKNMTRDTYKFVPIQDFTDKSDINWNKSIKEIDMQLYAKYNLSDDEIAFIESMIKPM